MLSFISKEVAFLFSPEAEETDRHFVDLMGCENTKHNIHKCWQHSTLCMVSVVNPPDHMADGELWLPAAAQHQERVLYCISLAQGKIKFQNSKDSFY